MAWADDDDKVWCRQGDRTFCTSPLNLAVGKSFYRLHDLGDIDVEYLSGFAQRFGNAGLTGLAQQWIKIFHALPLLRRQYLDSAYRTGEGVAALDAAINDMEEELHTLVEGGAVPLLEKARALDTSFLREESSALAWMVFIATQYIRTPKRRELGVDALRILPGVNAEACWGVMRVIMAMSSARGLLLRQSTLRWSFLRAPKGVEFVTADQPLINLAANGVDLPTEMRMFYPLDPHLAVEMDFYAGEASERTVEISGEQVVAFNNRMASESHTQVYARREETLHRLR